MVKLKIATDKTAQKETRKQKDKSLKLTRAEIADRVSELRKELAAAKQRYDGALFDSFAKRHARVARLCKRQ
jgi:hypothetical protein